MRCRGPNLRLQQQHPPDGASGRQQRLRFPGLRAGYIRPLFCRGIGHSLMALSKRLDIYKTDAKVKECQAISSICTTGWIWRAAHPFAGDCGAYLLGRSGWQPKSSVWRLQEMRCAAAESHADRRWPGSHMTPAPSPAEPRGEAMRDGSDAVSNLAATQRPAIPPAAWLCGHRCTTAAQGGMGFSQHSGMVMSAMVPMKQRRVSPASCTTTRPPA